jgi:molybdopterin-guanine dinucleotide biosynthesis protein A
MGVVLAGGLGTRIGGSKATVGLGGRPLISYPLDALGAVLDDVVVLAKADTELPSLPGMTVWIEPQAPRHPLIGVVQALALAGSRAVLVCPVDLPFVTPRVIHALVTADPGAAPAVIATGPGGMQPLLGCYRQAALGPLSAVPAGSDVTMRDRVAALRPRLLEIDDPDALFNVNGPDDLLHAAAMLDQRRRRVRS